MALLLRRKGVSRVRPLAGGIDGWRGLGYPVAPARRWGGDRDGST